MKTKILEALKNKYKNLGFSDKVFEGVTNSIQTFVKEEAEIATYVDGAESMLKAFQSSADQLRQEKALLEKENSELKALKDKEPKEPKEPKEQPPTPPTLDLDAIADIVKQAISPFQQKVEALELGEKKKQILTTAKTQFLTDEIHPERKALAELAFETVSTSISNDTLPETIVNQAKDFFNKQCSAIGVSGYKPEGSEGDAKPKSAAQEFVEKQQSNTESKTSKIAERLGIETKD